MSVFEEGSGVRKLKDVSLRFDTGCGRFSPEATSDKPSTQCSSPVHESLRRENVKVRTTLVAHFGEGRGRRHFKRIVDCKEC